MDLNLVLTISMPPSLMYEIQLHTYLESCQNRTVSLHKNIHTDLYGNIICNMNVHTAYNRVRILCALIT